LLEKKDPERKLARAAERQQKKNKEETPKCAEDQRDEKSEESHSQRNAKEQQYEVKAQSKIRNRYIPSMVMAAVWKRDGGECSYVLPSGKRCGERRFLEFDHVKPFALSGEHSAANVRLLCRSHNHYWAEQTYGRQEFLGEVRNM
jgi:5-methylcytosine-specific restriction endonuclease McrA